MYANTLKILIILSDSLTPFLSVSFYLVCILKALVIILAYIVYSCPLTLLQLWHTLLFRGWHS